MKNKVLKTAIALILIIALTISDFALIGTELVTYALENINNSTNNENVKFSAYFKTEEKEVSKKEYQITSEEMKLYIEVAVEDEGYFEGVITLEDSNFQIKQDKLSEGISKIEGNTITLNRVRAGNSTEIEVGIEPVKKELCVDNMLSRESVIKLIGQYKDSTEKNINIEAEKKVKLSLLAPTDLETTLEGKVITNRIYKIKEANKRIVQIELNSTVVENAYPIKTTKFEVALPSNVEDLEIISKGTYATNGQKDKMLEESNYKHDAENKLLNITIQNASQDGKISWKQGAKDSIIVTLILPETSEFEEEYSVRSKVEFYGAEEKVIEKEAKYNLNKEADGIIRASIDNKEEIYKGKIYSKEEREYNTTTNIEVNYANLIDASTLEEKTTYKADKEAENKLSSIEYKTTTISKAEIEKILGKEGTLTIRSEAGDELAKITKDSATDENGDIVIIYNTGVKVLNTEITRPVETGIIRLNHTKVIKAEEYSKTEIDEIKYLVEQAKIKYSTAEYSFESRKELGETKTALEFTVDKQTLSTVTTNEQVKMAVTLKTDSEEYDLYKNPIITIKLPNGVKNVSNIKTILLYLDNFTEQTKYISETREIQIKLNGEQKQYNGSNTNGYIEIMSDIELDEMLPNQKDIITLTYTNEKGVIYQNDGKYEMPINLTGHSGLVALNQINGFDVKTNSVTSKENNLGSLKMYQNAEKVSFEIALINNTTSDLKNVKVLGNFPTEGNITIGKYKFENTIAATLETAINTQNQEAKVYYTSNINATEDLQNEENQWNTNLAEVTNPVLYMIIISNMAKETNFIAKYTMQIPANLEYSKDTKTTYVVNYEANNTTQEVINAIPVGLETGKVLVTLDAKVGTDKLENGMTVKAGEVIKYKVNVTNTGATDAKDLKISGLIPEGTIYVEPVEEFEHAAEIYYKEIEQPTIEKTIDNLLSQETKTIEYEVRVKNDIATEIIENEATVTYNNNIEVKSNKLANKLEKANIRITVKRVAYTESLMPGAIGQYYVIVENISNIEQRDIKMKFNMPDEETMTLKHIEEAEKQVLETKNEWTVDVIPAGEYRIYSLFLEVNKINIGNARAELNAVAIQNENTYRANVYIENLYGFNIEMSMTSPNEGEYLETNETIEYHIEIKNQSEIAVGLMFMDNIPEQLSIQKVEINGELLQGNLLDNSICKLIDIQAKTTATIKIHTIVNYDRSRLENEIITNIANVSYAGEELATTGSVRHIIESIVVEEDEKQEQPVEPENPDEPVGPETPEESEKPEEPIIKNKYNISGKAWVDQDKDGQINNEDTVLKGIKVRLLNVEKNEFVRTTDKNKDLILETNSDGYYEFENILEGKYIVVFEYNKTLYKPTIYQKEAVEESKNSNVVSKKLTVNGEEQEYAATNEIQLNQNIANIDMGLVFIKQFDIELNKYISKVIIQTSKETTTYDYKNKDFVKAEINAKRIVGSTILVQYTMQIINTGDVDAYINSIVDYIPAGLKFSSELNKEWYESSGNLYTNKFEGTAIAPGEGKEVNLILTKTKTEGNAELINNMAEIQSAYNIYGIADINSKEANKNKDENDLGSADLLIGIQTGTVFNYIALVISMLGVIGVSAYLINKRVLRIKI